MRRTFALFCASLAALLILFSIVTYTNAQDMDVSTYVAWSPTGEYIAVGHLDTLTILDGNTLQPSNTLQDTVHFRDFGGATPAWSPDGKFLAIADGANINIWEMIWDPLHAQIRFSYSWYLHSTFNNDATTAPRIRAITWRYDGSQLAVAAGSSVYIIDTQAGEHIRQIHNDDWGFITDIDWSSNDQLAITENEFSVIIMNPFSGMLESYLSLGNATGLGGRTLDTVSFSPDGTRLAAGSSEGTVALWNDIPLAQTETQFVPDPSLILNSRSIDEIGVYDLQWSPDGQYIATVDGSEIIRIWQRDNGMPLEEFSTESTVFTISISWSPDGTQLIYESESNMVGVFDGTNLANE